MTIHVPSPARFRFAVAFVVAVFAFEAVAHAASPAPDKVSLRKSTIAWSTVKFATDAENGFVRGSLDKKSIVDRTFRSYVLENRYLKVTLVPEFGGRIVSIIYKPTGHEQLYRTQVGVPYGIGAGNFYYDWLMVYGGIFPTFPDAEHGKTWLKPWEFKVVNESAGEVTVSMSIKDNFAYSRGAGAVQEGLDGHRSDDLCHAEGRPRGARYAGGAEKSARPARSTTSTGPARRWRRDRTRKIPKPPAAPKSSRRSRPTPRPTGRAISPTATRARVAGKNRFEKLRYFRNWPTMGIAYAAPDMQGGNFWGVINHDNEEGIIRIADNTVTRGLKMWTWGFPSFANGTDPRKEPSEAQPYIELWAGVSDQFFHSASFPAGGEVLIPETYSPIVGMSDVTDANENILINLSADGVRRTSSVLQHRTGGAAARDVEARRGGIVRRRRGGGPEKRQSHFGSDS